jgi:hypothetical protein
MCVLSGPAAADNNEIVSVLSITALFLACDLL